MSPLTMTTVFTLVSSVMGHGYMMYPLARQRYCYDQQDYYWPKNGSGIVNNGCRKAFQYVYKKYGNNSAAAQAMFNQNTEYAALAGKDYTNMTHIKKEVVGHTLCGAGANDTTKMFGDKSGMDLLSNDWFVNKLLYSPSMNLYFCPTARHEPSYFELYISKDNNRVLKWDDLRLVYRNVSRVVTKKIMGCSADQVYELADVNLPHQTNQFVLYVRWQRNDIMGEGFYNCADVVFKQHDEL